MSNLAGQKFNRLTAIEFVRYHVSPGGSKKQVWKFRCDCGTVLDKHLPSVTRGRARSCGCLRRETGIDRLRSWGRQPGQTGPWPKKNTYPSKVIHKFYTIGNLNTIIYQLSTVKAYADAQHGRCSINVVPLPDESIKSVRLRFGNMLGLVKYQPYIKCDRFALRSPDCLNLDAIDPVVCKAPWLFTGVKNPVAKVLIHWKNIPESNPPKLAWQELVSNHGDDCVFLGSAQELQLFRSRTGVGDMNRTAHRNYFQRSRMIFGCELFAGNRNVLSAIAEGLGVKMLMEINGKLVPVNHHPEVSPSTSEAVASPDSSACPDAPALR